MLLDVLNPDAVSSVNGETGAVVISPSDVGINVTSGIVTQTALDTFVGRTITGTANQVVVTNGNGVSGNPTLSLPQSIHTGASPTFAGGNFVGAGLTYFSIYSGGSGFASEVNFGYSGTRYWHMGRDGTGKFSFVESSIAVRLTIAAGGLTTLTGSFIPGTDSTFTLGSSSLYWSNTYTDRLYLNATAYLDGASAGVIGITGNVKVTTGTSTGFAKVGGTIQDHYTDSSVGGAEADIYTYTTPANTLATNGDKIVASYGGNFVTGGTELTQLKAYFAGTAIWDSTGVAPTTGTTSWRVTVELIRVSATVVRYTVSLNTTGATGYVYAVSGELTGLTLSGTNIIKLTGTSSGVGSGVGDIVGKMGSVSWLPAA